MSDNFNLSTSLAYAHSIVNKKLGRTFSASIDDVIPLSKIQYAILFLIVLGKSPSDITKLISKLENIAISQCKINSIITDQIYNKLKVNSNEELIEKAVMLNLVNHIPPELLS